MIAWMDVGCIEYMIWDEIVCDWMVILYSVSEDLASNSSLARRYAIRGFMLSPLLDPYRKTAFVRVGDVPMNDLHKRL